MDGPNRKHSRPKGRNGGSGPKGPKKGGQNFNNKHGRPVSSNYTVDLFHHQLSGMTQQQPATGGNQQPAPKSHPPKGHHRPGKGQGHNKPSARKGYTFHSFEIKDELYKEFNAKLKDSSKTPKEVINQLISFFNMGKIKI